MWQVHSSYFINCCEQAAWHHLRAKPWDTYFLYLMLRNVLQCISYSPSVHAEKKSCSLFLSSERIPQKAPQGTHTRRQNDGFIMSSVVSTQLLKHNCGNPHRMVAPWGEDVPLEYHSRDWQAGLTLHHPARRRAAREHQGMSGPGIRLLTGVGTGCDQTKTGLEVCLAWWAHGQDKQSCGQLETGSAMVSLEQGVQDMDIGVPQKAAKKMKQLEHLLWGRAGTGEEKTPERSFQIIQPPEGRVQRRYWALFSNAQRQPKRHKLKHKRLPLNIRKYFYFVWGSLNTGKSYSERLWSLLPWRYSLRETIWATTRETRLGNCFFLNSMSPHSNNEVQYNLNHSMILWYFFFFLVFWTFFFFYREMGNKRPNGFCTQKKKKKQRVSFFKNL